MTIAGPSIDMNAASSVSGRIRPMSSVSIVLIRADPRPRNRSAAKMVACASAPTITSMAGAPNRPSFSTSQPARRSSSLRAAARPTKFAMVAPVTNPTDALRGKSSSSRSQLAETCSAATAAGVPALFAAFWPQAEVSQSAATPARCDPPITQPKKPALVMARRPGDAFDTSSPITSADSVGFSGRGPSNALISSEYRASGEQPSVATFLR